MEMKKASSLICNGSIKNWVSNSGWKISTGVLGAAGIVFATRFRSYLDFNISYEDGASSPSVWVVPGLQNLGNNCFLNVVLQALSSCSIFQKYLWEMIEGYGSSSLEEVDKKWDGENLPLFSSLASLVEELCTVRQQRTVLSPRKLMAAMDHYIPNFNLSRQQDAEEAFSHLLSSLREEISEHCVPNTTSLANLPALPNGRILTVKSSNEENDRQRWSRSFLKPFDGILGSILVCQQCLFQISLDFQLFHSLHLSPPMSSDSTIMAGCTLDDCLRRYFVAENIENYRCSNCWHNSAVEYLSLLNDKKDIEKLQSCNRIESCECRTLSSLEAFPWSNRFSRTLKQLSIARSPKILCIHFQRASYNVLGQSMKLRGHISFPLILNLSSFINTGVGIKATEPYSLFRSSNQSSHRFTAFPHFTYQTTLLDPGMSSKANTEHTISLEAAGCKERNAVIVENGPSLDTGSPDCASCADSKASTEYTISSEAAAEKERKTIAVGNGPCPNTISLDAAAEKELNAVAVENSLHPDTISKDSAGCTDSNANFNTTKQTRHAMYRLVSVVEHFGSNGGGHYTVHRRVKGKVGEEGEDGAIERWFCISDSQVECVLEREVFHANASMLFYERIEIRQ